MGNSPLNIFWDGNLAVIVFFCLSGYLIARNTKRRKTNIFNDLFSSISKRYLRLMPCVAFSILVMYILMKLDLLFHADIVGLLGDEYVLEYNMFNPNIFDAIFEAVIKSFFVMSEYNSPLWTIPWEIWAGTLLVLLQCWRPKNQLIKYVAYGFLIIGCYCLKLQYFICFLLGVIIYDIQRLTLDQNLVKYKNWISLVGVFLMSIPTNGKNGLYTFMNYSLIPSGYLHMVGSAIFIWALTRDAFPAVFLKIKVLEKMGNISFSTYVIHWPVILSIGCGIFLLLYDFCGYNYNAAALLAYGICIIVSFLLGKVINKYIENLFRRKKVLR